jgi:phosphatidylglycerophosphatase A
MKKLIVNVVATGLGTGYAPVASGTIGSIPPWIVAYFLIANDQMTLVIVTLILSVISIWFAGQAEENFGHDSKKIVIDEWAGMFFTLLFIPYSLVNYLIAFFVFRAFDVIKIYPARKSERLPGGWGVTMDDVIAGVQSNIVTQIIIFIIAQFQ